jgi:hypothetical protein
MADKEGANMLLQFIVFMIATVGVAAGGLGLKGFVWPPPTDKMGVVLILMCCGVLVLAAVLRFAIHIGREILALNVDPGAKAKMFKDVFEPVQSTLGTLTGVGQKVTSQ